MKCLELEDLLAEQGYGAADIEEKVSAYRAMLLEKDAASRRKNRSDGDNVEIDDFGRPVYKDSHQMAEALRAKNDMLRQAFGIGKGFVDGSSFDANRRCAVRVGRVGREVI